MQRENLWPIYLAKKGGRGGRERKEGEKGRKSERGRFRFTLRSATGEERKEQWKHFFKSNEPNSIVMN